MRHFIWSSLFVKVCKSSRLGVSRMQGFKGHVIVRTFNYTHGHKFKLTEAQYRFTVRLK